MPRFLNRQNTLLTFLAIVFVLIGRANASDGYLYRETDSTNRLALSMLGASTLKNFANVFNQKGQKQTELRILFSIDPAICLREGHCDSEVFDVLSNNGTHFFASARYTSVKDLNKACIKAEKDHVGFIDYAGRTDVDLKFNSLQIWYKCGTFDSSDTNRVEAFKTKLYQYILISIAVGLGVLGGITATYYYWIRRLRGHAPLPQDPDQPANAPAGANVLVNPVIPQGVVHVGQEIEMDDVGTQRTDSTDAGTSNSGEGGVDNKGLDVESTSGDTTVTTDKKPLIVEEEAKED